MARQRHLRNAPITEAAIHFQVNQFSAEFGSASTRLAEKLAPDYYHKGSVDLATLAVSLPAAAGTLPIARTASRSIGARLHSQSEKYVLQVLHHGLTVSRLEPYEDWDRLRDEMRRIWELYREEFHPAAIARIAVRYINTILLTLEPGTRLEKVFTRPPMEPEGMPDLLSSFLNRCVVEDPASKASVVVTLASQFPTPNVLPVILDIEAIRQSEFPVAEQSTWDYLETLRALKNAAFFGSLQEEQIHKYE